jgi:hypothetical protein
MPLLEVIRGDIREPGSLRFRNKPDAPCILQYSTDGGSSWRDGFDFDLCLGGLKRQTTNIWEVTVGPTIVNTYEQIVNEYTTNNDMSVFAPQMVYTGLPVEDGWRDAALCQAARAVVDSVCELELAGRRRGVAIGQVTNIVLGLVSAVIGAAAAATAPASAGASLAVYALYFAAGSALVGVGATIIQELSEATLGSQEFRETVACCMFCALKGQTPSKAVFQDSLSGCDFPFGSSEAQLAGAIAPFLQRDDVFATFVRAAQDNIRAAQLGLIACPCECDQALKIIVRCATFVTVGGVQAESLGGNVWQFDPPASGTMVEITSSVPPNVSAFDADTLGNVSRYDQVTMWYYSDLRPITPPASYITLTNVWYVQPAYTNGTSAESPPQGSNPLNAVTYPYNEAGGIFISFNW